MDLILWRHAEADDAGPDGDDRGRDLEHDLQRDLTRKGERQARRVARWLDQHLGDTTRIWSGPAVRAQRTAAALGRPYKVRDELHPQAAAADVLALMGWTEDQGLPQRKPLLIVGHQPWLGDVASRLLGCHAAGLTIRKGTAWWLRSRADDEAAPVTLFAALPPDLASPH